MLRKCYSLLLRLHPAAFRQRFGQEMLAIFDEVAVCQGARGLFLDAGVSLFRQWVLRPEFRTADACIPVPAGAPGFTSLEDYRMRPVAVMYGSVLSVFLFWAVIFVIDHPGRTQRWAVGAYRTATGLFSFSRSSAEGVGPDTQVVMGTEPENPWHAVASGYFRSMPVLKALDRDGDLTISPAEISAAPAMLLRLDKNNDGKLSADECGFFLGPSAPTDAAFLTRAHIAVMRANPVLSVLDVDHDGEISADEIANSSRSLRRLDTNGDGYLTPPEVLPKQTDGQAASIFGLLDVDHDGRISAAEGGREESATLREILMSADRNHDGFTTMRELTEELLIREGASVENDRTPKAAPGRK